MGATAIIVCPGCTLALPAQGLIPPARFQASGECYALYNELSFYTLSHGSPAFIHQTAVDAYAAQHTSDFTKPITTVFSLVGLCLAVEHCYSGKQVQNAHMLLAQQPKNWLSLPPPTLSVSVSVLDVMLEDAGSDRDAALVRWAEAVWRSWQSEHAYIRQVIAQHL